MKSNLVMAEEVQDISKVILYESQKLMQNMKKEVEKIIVDKNEEISWLKEYNENYLHRSRIQRLKRKK